MQPIAHHMNFHLLNPQVIAPSVVARRRVAGILLREEYRINILAFRAVDTHVHLLVLADRGQAGRLVQRVGSALRQALGLPVPFEQAWYERVVDQRHLLKAFGYVLRNSENHGSNADLHHDASVLPDILGMRSLAPELGLRVREHLGRLARADLEAVLGLPFPEPAFHAEHLYEAACASLALPDLSGNAPLVVRARVTAARVAMRELSASETADILGYERRSVFRLAYREENPALTRAMGLQMSFRKALEKVLSQKSGTCVTGMALRSPPGA